MLKYLSQLSEDILIIYMYLFQINSDLVRSTNQCIDIRIVVKSILVHSKPEAFVFVYCYPLQS